MGSLREILLCLEEHFFKGQKWQHFCCIWDVACMSSPKPRKNQMVHPDHLGMNVGRSTMPKNGTGPSEGSPVNRWRKRRRNRPGNYSGLMKTCDPNLQNDPNGLIFWNNVERDWNLSRWINLILTFLNPSLHMFSTSFSKPGTFVRRWCRQRRQRGLNRETMQQAGMWILCAGFHYCVSGHDELCSIIL